MTDDGVSLNGESELKHKKLVETLTARTAHQYKSYYTKYVKWCAAKGFVAGDSGLDRSVYESVPLSHLHFHWFILDNFIAVGRESKLRQVSDNLIETNEALALNLSTLKKIISSLKFFSKLCACYRDENDLLEIDERYLESVIKLHGSWYENHLHISEKSITNNRNLYSPLLKISLNLWNTQTSNLSEKSFKTCLEKIRFLVDFQFQSYLNLSYEVRSSLNLIDLKIPADASGKLENLICLNLNYDDGKTIAPLVLLPQECPFLCPITSLATYLFLRFYGIKDIYKGDGFPDLSISDSEYEQIDYSAHSKLSASLIHYTDLPLTRGKSPLDYPKDETMSLYYSTIFRYCHLPYKRREYFNRKAVEFPSWDSAKLEEFLEKSGNAEAFKFNVPFDFRQILNHKSPYTTYKKADATNVIENDVPQGLLQQIFPELEFYKSKINSLSDAAKSFIQLIELLRLVLLKQLPWIYHIFPDHDLFKNSVFFNKDFQDYINKILKSEQGSLTLPFRFEAEGQKCTLSDIYDSLIEPPVNGLSEDKAAILQSNSGSNLVALSPVNGTSSTSSVDINGMIEKATQEIKIELNKKFNQLVSSLTHIFEQADMPDTLKDLIKSSMHTLNGSMNTVTEKDIKPDLEVRLANNASKFKEKPAKKVGLLDLGGSSSDEDEEEYLVEDSVTQAPSISTMTNNDAGLENDEDGMQQELEEMVKELVDQQTKKLIQEQFVSFEKHITSTISNLIDEKLTSFKEEISETSKQRRNLDPEFFDKAEPPKKRKLADNTIELTVPELASHEPSQFGFKMDANISCIEDIILEWFTPNPQKNNECIQSMNKKHGKRWRTDCESTYKDRKVIVEFYIDLVNNRNKDRYTALQICENLKQKHANASANTDVLSSLAKFLRNYKSSHNNTFENLLSTV